MALKSFLYLTIPFLLTVSCNPRNETSDKKPSFRQTSDAWEINENPEQEKKLQPEKSEIVPRPLSLPVPMVRDQKIRRKGSESLPEDQKPVSCYFPEPEGSEESVSLKVLLAAVQKSSQTFRIDPEKDTVITGEQGTKLTIPKGIWQTQDGKKVSGNVRFELKEFYKKGEMLLAGLSTYSSGQMLETGGMICLEAYAGNEKLTLVPGGNIKVEMPATEYKEDMELFYASSEEDDFDWRQAVPDRVHSFRNYFSHYVYFTENGNKLVEIEKDDKPFADCYRASCQVEKKGCAITFSKSGAIHKIEQTGPEKHSVKLFKYQEGETISGQKTQFRKVKTLDKGFAYRIDVHESGKREPESYYLSKKSSRLIRKSLKKGEQVQMIIESEYTGRSNACTFSDSCLTVQVKDNSKITASAIQTYVFELNQTGWINCDRFYKVPADKKCDLIVRTEGGAEVNLIFKDINSILRTSESGKNASFRSIPKNAEVTVIAVKAQKDKILFASKECNTSELEIRDLSFQEVSLEELTAKLLSLN